MKTLDEIKKMMSSGDTAKAAEALKELLAKEPTNLQAKMLYGTCCQLLGDEETFNRIHDELAPNMKYTLVFHDETTEFGAIKTLGVYLQVLIDAIVFLVIAMAAILLSPLMGVILGAAAVACLWYARTNNKSEPCLKRESKMEPRLAADGCREDNECWICGDKCHAGEAFQVKMSGNCVKHVEQMFLHTTIRKAWQSVVIDVPCCHRCQKSIDKSRRLHKGKLVPMLLLGGTTVGFVIGFIRCSLGDFSIEMMICISCLFAGIGMFAVGILACIPYLVIRELGMIKHRHWRKIVQYPAVKEFAGMLGKSMKFQQ